ncbi:MAG TPA: branched-chain amino acid ABC transporter permease [Stellaceae bacterium]|nr:branched-chain amino acid ABC transporter permease [Stellaceae bacterium]
MTAAALLFQLLNGLQFAMLLFLLAVGLSIVFGLMNFINLAHGTLYMVGAFVGFAAAARFGSFWAALIAGPAAAALIGAIFYALLLRRMQSESPMKQVLVTFGLIFVGIDTVRLIWGEYAQTLAAPAGLDRSVHFFGQVYPAYRLFIIALGLSLALALYLGLERTKLGAIVRAGVDDRVMAASLGIDVGRAFFTVFCIGCALAGLAGVVAAPVLEIYPGMDMAILIPTLIVVVVGGPGRLSGAFLGALLIGMAETFGAVLIPEFSSFLIYAVMALVLLLRPSGLLPARHTA